MGHEGHVYRSCIILGSFYWCETWATRATFTGHVLYSARSTGARHGPRGPRLQVMYYTRLVLLVRDMGHEGHVYRSCIILGSFYWCETWATRATFTGHVLYSARSTGARHGPRGPRLQVMYYTRLVLLVRDTGHEGHVYRSCITLSSFYWCETRATRATFTGHVLHSARSTGARHVPRGPRLQVMYYTQLVLLVRDMCHEGHVYRSCIILSSFYWCETCATGATFTGHVLYSARSTGARHVPRGPRLQVMYYTQLVLLVRDMCHEGKVGVKDGRDGDDDDHVAVSCFSRRKAAQLRTWMKVWMYS